MLLFVPESLVPIVFIFLNIPTLNPRCFTLACRSNLLAISILLRVLLDNSIDWRLERDIFDFSVVRSDFINLL